MRKASAGDGTIRKYPQLLVSVMHRAVDQNLINRNPVTAVTGDHCGHGDTDALNRAQ